MFLIARVAASILILAAFTRIASADENACTADKRVVETCRQVHGRVSVHANLRIYLAAKGSAHLMGIDFDPPLPPNLSKLLSPDASVSGDYLVCPFSVAAPGKLQTGCIASAQHLVSRPEHK